MLVQPEKQNVKIARICRHNSLNEQAIENILKYNFEITLWRICAGCLIISNRWSFRMWNKIRVGFHIQETGFIRHGAVYDHCQRRGDCLIFA